MTDVPSTFAAFRIHDDAAGYRSGIEQIALDDLAPGEVVIRAAFSSVNFKDALAGTGKGKILRKFPLVGGIDVAGHVVASTDPRFKEGDAVLATGSGLSETRDGGYSEYVRLPAQWTIPLPDGLSLRESMILGTAGFTAALALLRMEDNRQTPALGPARGHRRDRRRRLAGGRHLLARRLRGACDQRQARRSRVPARPRRHAKSSRRDALATTRPMETARFGGGLDNVGGAMLASLLAQTAPYGNVASARPGRPRPRWTRP